MKKRDPKVISVIHSFIRKLEHLEVYIWFKHYTCTIQLTFKLYRCNNCPQIKNANNNDNNNLFFETYLYFIF